MRSELLPISPVKLAAEGAEGHGPRAGGSRRVDVGPRLVTDPSNVPRAPCSYRNRAGHRLVLTCSTSQAVLRLRPL